MLLALQLLLYHLQTTIFFFFVDLPSVTTILSSTIYRRYSRLPFVPIITCGARGYSTVFFGLRGGGIIMALDADPSRQGVSGKWRQRLLGGGF